MAKKVWSRRLGGLRPTWSRAVLLGLSVLTLVGTTEVPAFAGGSSSPTIASSPASATTATPLTWTFTSTAAATSCELDRSGTVVSALADCSSGDPSATFDVSSQPGGSYTFTVFDAAATDVDGSTPSDSSTVDVAPVAPTVSLTTSSPNNSRTPAWTFDTPTGATDACELDDPDGHAVNTQNPCTSPYVGDLSGHDDGDYSLSVTATAGGVAGASDSASYQWDTTAPVAPTVVPPVPTGSDRTPTFRLSGIETGATLTCAASDPDGNSLAIGNCFSGHPTVQIPDDGPDGEYTLSVAQTDVAGNVSAVGSGEYLLDTVAPPAPDVTAPANPSADRSPSFAVTDAESGVSYQCSIDGPSTVSVSSCGPTTTADLSGADNGWYTLSVSAVDAAGNVSTAGTAQYLFDIPAPAPVVSGPATGQGRSPSFAVTDSQGGVTFSCTVSGPSTVTVSSCGATSSLDLTDASDGHYVLSVVATDSFGQDSQAGTATYVLDTTAPPAPLVSGPATGHVLDPSFDVTDSESDLTYTCTVDGPSTVSVNACDATTTLDLTGGSDGTYTVSVTASDAAGNISSQTQASYVLDTVPPPAPDVVAPPSPSNDTSPTFAISDSESGVVLSCVLIDPDVTTIFSGTCPGSGAFDTSASSDGTYQLLVTATDQAGNVTSTDAAWTRDTTPPPAPVVTAPASPSSDVIAGFTVTEADSTATLTCTMTASDGAVVLDGTCPPDGNVDTTGFVDGTFTFSVTATDAVGNSVTTPVTWTRDTTPPPPPTVTAPTSPSQDLTPTFQLADAESGATLHCVLLAPDNTAVSSGTCPTDGTLNTGALHDGNGDGTYTLQVSAVDEVGNVSDTSTATYTLDTVAPPVPDVTAPAATGHSRMPAFTVTDAESGVTFSCTVTFSGGPTSVTVGNCDGSPVLGLTGAPDGTYTLSVTATDVAGNTSAAGSDSYLLDSVSPPAPTVSAPASPAQGRTPTFTVTDTEPGVGFTCAVTFSGGPTSVTVGNCNGSPVLDLTGAPDGTYTLSVTASDAAGNTSPAHSAFYTLDTTAPLAPTVVAPPSPSNDTTPNFWISDSDSPVTLSCVFTAPDDTVLVNGSCPTGGTFATTMDGVYTLTVTATDEAGNATTTAVTWTLDTAAPPAPAVVVPPSPGKTLSPTFGISDSEADTTLTCLFTSQSHRTVASGTCPVSGTFSTSGFGDGTYTLVVTATDPAGNTAATTVTWVRDTTKPAAPVVTPVQLIGNSRSPAFTVTDADPTVTSFSCTTSPTVTVTSCGPTSTLDLTGAADGLYTLTVTATDPAGNVSATGGSATYILDTTPPPAPVVTSPASPSNKLAPVFPVSDTELGVTYTCSVIPAGVIVTRCPVLGGPASVKLNLAGDPDAVYTVSVTATDAQGNVSNAGTATYTLDTTPPATPVVIAPSSPSNNPKPVFGISEPGTDPSVTLGCVLVGPDSATIASEPCPASGQFDTADDSDGTYVLTVTATDGAGNTASATASFVLDTTPPTAPTVTDISSSPGNSDSVTFSYTAHEAGTVLNCVLTYSDGTVISSAMCPSSPGGFTVGSSGDGVYTLTVTATDAAGNISAAGHASYTLDTTPPPAPSISPLNPSASTGNSKAPSFTVSDTEPGVTFTCSALPNVPITSCGASAELNLTGQSDGSYVLSVTATDAAGNISSAGTATYLLDTTAPATPVVSPSPATLSQVGQVGPDEWTGNNATPTFSVASDAQGDAYTDRWLSYTCTVSASATVTTCGPATQLQLNGDLTYTLTVTVKDLAGNTSSVSNTVTYVLDTIAPDAPKVILVSGSPSSNTTPFWEWTGGASEQFPVTARCTLIGPHNTSTAVACPDSSSTAFQTPLTGGKGTYQLVATITDLAGNVSPPSTTLAPVPSYELDPKAAFKPTVFVLSPGNMGRSRSPVWKVIPGQSATTQCQLFRGDDQHGTPISTQAPCSGGTWSYNLAGLADGDYTLVVTATEPDNTLVAPVSSTYTLDTTPPHAPRLLHGTDRVSSDATPEWTFELPPDASTGLCVWSRGDTVLFTQQHCQSETTFSLGGLGDGTITVRVYAYDAAGNRSQPLVITHILDRNPPGRPDVSPPSGDSATAVWTVHSDGGNALTCTLLNGHGVVSSARSCGSHPTYQMGSLPSGTYTLSVTETDSLGVTGPAAAASWVWLNGSGGGQPNPGGGGTTPTTGNSHHPHPPKHVVPPVTLLPKVVQHVINKLGHAIKNPGPTVHKVIKNVLPVPGPVSHAVQSAVSAVGQAGGGTGFPLILVGLVIVFLIVQNRIDRRDPKLAFVSVAADDLVEFQPPPSQEDGA